MPQSRRSRGTPYDRPGFGLGLGLGPAPGHGHASVPAPLSLRPSSQIDRSCAPSFSPPGSPRALPGFGYYEGGHMAWRDGFVPRKCALCNRVGDHSAFSCPFLAVATQLDIFKKTHSSYLCYQSYYLKEYSVDASQGDGHGSYSPPCQEDVERSAADATRLQKDGMNMIRITSHPQVYYEAEELHHLCQRIGRVTNAIVFQGWLCFVNFARKEDALTALRCFSGYGHQVMWADQV